MKNQMTYKTYSLMVSFDNGVSGKDFQVVAVSPEAAFEDIKEAYGECILLQHDMGR